MLKINKLDQFLSKCHATLKEYPQESKEVFKAMYDLIHIALYLGYIRGREGKESIDPEEVFNELFSKFLSNEWKRLDKNREEFFLDEDFFTRLSSETLDLAERLFPIVKELYGEELWEAEKR
jgi:CRISPR/Cas system CSM-associated protein Csm2 small subunit